MSALRLREPDRCTVCGCMDNLVVNSRPEAWWIRRRRRCQVCGNRWTTYELTLNPRRLRQVKPVELRQQC